MGLNIGSHFHLLSKSVLGQGLQRSSSESSFRKIWALFPPRPPRTRRRRHHCANAVFRPPRALLFFRRPTHRPPSKRRKIQRSGAALSVAQPRSLARVKALLCPSRAGERVTARRLRRSQNVPGRGARGGDLAGAGGARRVGEKQKHVSTVSTTAPPRKPTVLRHERDAWSMVN